MTNEEAIEIIKSYKYEHAVGGYLKVNEAFDMAIEALRREALVEKMTKAYYKELRGEANNDKVNRC